MAHSSVSSCCSKFCCPQGATCYVLPGNKTQDKVGLLARYREPHCGIKVRLMDKTSRFLNFLEKLNFR